MSTVDVVLLKFIGKYMKIDDLTIGYTSNIKNASIFHRDDNAIWIQTYVGKYYLNVKDSQFVLTKSETQFTFPYVEIVYFDVEQLSHFTLDIFPHDDITITSLHNQSLTPLNDSSEVLTVVESEYYNPEHLLNVRFKEYMNESLIRRYDRVKPLHLHNILVIANNDDILNDLKRSRRLNCTFHIVSKNITTTNRSIPSTNIYVLSNDLLQEAYEMCDALLVKNNDVDTTVEHLCINLNKSPNDITNDKCIIRYDISEDIVFRINEALGVLYVQ